MRTCCSAAALLVLGTSSDDRLSALRAGEARSAVLLKTTGPAWRRAR
ncbi:hypothetical protein [Saccharothrix algeriensis]|uniref:Uncharacterized protein n=1 Tax=Saccharothrix algeriensis TaxID=173560 RepID=A0ABS2S0F1_9PSEU|nr:hypothetical protein [Saccharothrix algeriensis]